MKTKINLLACALLCLGLVSACEAVNLDNPTICSASTDCSGGEVCREGVCSPLCSDDSECDFYCDIINGTCSKCLINAHCPDGFVCNVGKGVCLAFCGSDSDCAEGEICQKGICADKQCTEDADCKGSGEKCLDLRCLAESADKYPEQISCEAGTLQCWDDKIVTCSTDGAEWNFSHICKEGDTCFAGFCNGASSESPAYVCQPYALKCATDKRLQICRPDGSQFVEWISCPDGSTCLNGDCLIETSEIDGDAEGAESVE